MRVSYNFIVKKSQIYVLFDYLECRRKKNVILLSVGSNVHQDTTIRYLLNKFSSRKQPSSEKIAALVFHSTNWTTDGSILFSGSCPQKKSLGQIFSVAIEKESPTTSVLKKGNWFASFYNFESRCKKTVTMLFADSYVHWDTKFR